MLGGLAVRIDGEPARLPADARARELLAWLALHPGTHPRASLAGRLRPDVLEESARKTLRDAVYELRRALGPDALVTTRDAVGLAADVAVDLARARAAAAAGDLAAAVDGGPLLDGLDADWAIAAREEHAAEVERPARRAEPPPTPPTRSTGPGGGSRSSPPPRPPTATSSACSPSAETGPPRLPPTTPSPPACAASSGSLPPHETRALADAIRRGGHARPSLEQGIRFTTVRGHRVAYAKVGSGPPLVLPAMWISHLEEEWTFPGFRAFVEALAAEHTVIRYDRLGTGLSDRDAPSPGMAAELETLSAVIDAAASSTSATGDARHDPRSWASPAAGRPPSPMRRARAPPPRATRSGGSPSSAPTPTAPRSPRRRSRRRSPPRSAPTGARAPASSPTSGCPARTRRSATASPPTSAPPPRPARPRSSSPRSTPATCARSSAPIGVPALVVHRRQDRAMPFAGARELAAALPDAELVALDGDIHPPWLGDSEPILAVLLAFLRNG